MLPISRSVALLVCLAVLAPTGLAQPANGLNVTKLSQLKEANGFSDIWGYVAPDGREYALLGYGTGLSIINASNPLQPFEVGRFPGPGCTWRDMKTWGPYVYEVNDCGPGVRVFDMTDPDNPVQVNHFGTNKFSHSHNIQIDPDTGLLYVVGTNVGMLVFDLAIDPVDPPHAITWDGTLNNHIPDWIELAEHGEPGDNQYIHDLYVKDGLAHLAQINSGKYTILDVSEITNAHVHSSINSGERFTHSNWANDDGTIIAVADETSGGKHLSLYDISDVHNPTFLSKYDEHPLAIPHNPFWDGDRLHVSWYVQGFVCLDVSDPSNPVKVAQYDTTPDVDWNFPVAFTGVWGVYPYQPSGFLYLSDINRGLYIVKTNLDCDADPSGRPSLCRQWPAATPSVVADPQSKVIVTGQDLDTITSVTVGGVALDKFNIKDHQTLIFSLPPLDTPGPTEIVVTSALGDSNSIFIDVQPPTEVVLNTGVSEVAVGDTMWLRTGSPEAGDQHLLVMGFNEIPSVIPGKVDFDIGNGFSESFMFPVLAANDLGQTAIPIPVPREAAGLTVYWQSAVVTSAGFPAVMTDVTSTTIVLP